MYERALSEPDPPPLTTIAWQLVHLARLDVMYHEYAFGAASRQFSDVPVRATRDEAVALWRSVCGTAVPGR